MKRTSALFVFAAVMCASLSGCTKDHDEGGDRPPEPGQAFHIRYKSDESWVIHYIAENQKCLIGDGFCCEFGENSTSPGTLGIISKNGNLNLKNARMIVQDTLYFNDEDTLYCFLRWNSGSSFDNAAALSYFFIEELSVIDTIEGEPSRIAKGRFQYLSPDGCEASLKQGNFRFRIY